MGVPALADEQLTPETVALGQSLLGNAPLWYYVLKEAEVTAGGNGLGPVGGRIVAEVLVGLVASDPFSYLRGAPAWRPRLGTGDDFSMSDLLAFSHSLIE